MIVYGGNDGAPSGEIWSLSLVPEPAWSLISTAGSQPEPRDSHAAIYDPVRDRMVIEGGPVIEMRAGDVFYIPPGPPGHDSWVVGDEPYVSLHFMGAADYAAHD